MTKRAARCNRTEQLLVTDKLSTRATAIGIGLAVLLGGGVIGLTPVPAAAGVAEPRRTERVSVSSDEVQASAFTTNRSLSVSADGRFVSFVSTAANLVPGDTNGRHDVFVRDRLLGTTERVSVSSTGVEGNGDSGSWGTNFSNSPPSISGDGRYVTFESFATNLTPGEDLNGSVQDVFVHDRSTHQTGRLAFYGRNPQISADGRYVTWDWEGTVSRRERMGGGHQTVIQGGTVPAISGDGRFVAFQSQNTLLPGDNNGANDIYVRDLLTGTLERASVTSSGEERPGHSLKPSLSDDGRFVAFQSNAPLVAADSSCCSTDTFVRDRVAGATERVNVSSGGAEANGESGIPRISGDGRFVAFESWASNLVAGDTANSQDVFLRDRAAGTTEMMSVSMTATSGGGYGSAVSADGRVVAFSSTGAGLVPGDTNAWEDAFVRDRGRRHRCDDGLDNDSDGLIDFGADPGCGASDDDDESGEPTATFSNLEVSEGDGEARFEVTLSGPADYEVRIDYGTADGTARAPDDYTAASGTLSIASGETAGTIAVPIQHDVVDEPDERFTLSLSNPRNALLAREQAVATILDDDRDGVFVCRASAFRGTGIEPAVANGPATPCTDGEAAALAFADAGGLPVAVMGLEARTHQHPDDPGGTQPAAGDVGEGHAAVNRVTIGSGPEAVTLRDLYARARSECAADGETLVRSLTGSSNVGSVQVGGGVPVAVGDSAVDLPLPGGATLHLNAEQMQGESILRRAAWIESAEGDVVIAEASAGTVGDPCSA